jgi:predicted helicase
MTPTEAWFVFPHVAGTFNALERNAELAWLKSPVAKGECRILTNARCLSEGVDVPALDAVLFLQPRNSIVDVVQSVGRVMRLSPEKEYGYVILPVAVPAGMEPSEALADNVRFKVVWQVLNALRSHDERFDAMINSIALNTGSTKTGEGSNQLLGAHIGPTTDDPPDIDTTIAGGPTLIALFSLSRWQEAVYTRIVDKVGTRVYWDQWAADVADIATAQITRDQRDSRCPRHEPSYLRAVRAVPQRVARQPQRVDHPRRRDQYAVPASDHQTGVRRAVRQS